MATTFNLNTYYPYSNSSLAQTEYHEMVAGIQYDGIIPTAFQQAPPTRNEFAVTANGADRQLTVATGRSFIEGLYGELTASNTLDIAANTSGSTRIDRIVLTVNWSTLVTTCAILQGTPAAGAPALTQTFGTSWQMSLCQVTVVNGAATLAQTDILDERQPAAPPGSWLRIESLSGTGASGTITHNNIPPYYRNLRLDLDLLGSAAANTSVSLQFNADAGANYAYIDRIATGTSADSASGNSGSSTIGHVAYAPGSTTSFGGHFEVRIPDYSRLTAPLQRTWFSTGMLRSAAAASVNDFSSVVIYGQWASTAIISRIDLIAASGNFETRSRSVLYGQV